MRTVTQIIKLGSLIIFAISAGCATKGYVRTQVGDLRQETEQRHAALRADLEGARGAGTRALAQADAAVSRADSSRSLALGHVGYRETGRYQVHFAFDSAELTDTAKGILDDAAGNLDANPSYLVELYGFCDPTGPDSYNLGLGQRRVGAVLRHLANRFPSQLNRFSAISFGETPPDHERPAWGSEREHQRQVLLVLVEKIPLNRRESLTAR